MVLEKNQQRMKDFVRISHAVGKRSDYIQGAGGNTSVKLSDRLMAIKASGYCLSDIRENKAFAVLDYRKISDFYYQNDPASIRDVEQAGSACAKENTIEVDGMEALRPSVEAGFHSILKTFVLHSHSVYANLAACSTACKAIAQIAFANAEYSWGWVPYTDPGAKLTFSIRDEIKRVQRETGDSPSVILMQNHGIIVHDDDADVCLAIHTDANNRLASLFGLDGTSFPQVDVRELSDSYFMAEVPYLKEQFKQAVYSQEQLLEQPLYPDQLVFLKDTFYLDKPMLEKGQGIASSKTGELLMHMPQRQAQTLAETLTAVFFIMENIQKAGYCIAAMGDSAKQFISNWESEKYRKSLTAGKG